MLKNQVFLDVRLCHCISSSRHSKDHSSFISKFKHWYSRGLNSSGIILVGGGWVPNISPCTSVSYHKVILFCFMYSSVTDKTTHSSTKERTTVLTQVYKNPHCALCNGVPPLNTTCWVPPRGEIVGRHGVLSLAIIMDFVAWEDENQQHRWEYVTETNDAAQKHRQVWWFEKFWN